MLFCENILLTLKIGSVDICHIQGVSKKLFDSTFD